MTPRIAMSFRLPEKTKGQIEQLAVRLGMTSTQVLVVAVDRMAREELGKRERPQKEREGP